MKHRLLLLFAMLSCLIVKAEHSYILRKALDSGQDYHYTAIKPSSSMIWLLAV